MPARGIMALTAIALMILTQSPARAQVVPEILHLCTPTIPATGDVLVVGGEDNFGNPLKSAELFHPATELFSTACNTRVARLEALSSNIPLSVGGSLAGKILVMGGEFARTVGRNTIRPHSKTTELYDPVSGRFRAGPMMKGFAEDTTQVQLTDGRILIAGGEKRAPNGIDAVVNTAEVFDPSKKRFIATKTPLTSFRDFIAPAQIVGCGCANEGKILIAGGSDTGDDALTSAELFDPAALTFTATGRMNFARAGATASTLSGGRILIAGGLDTNGNSLDTAEIYDPVAGTFALTTTAFPATGTNMADSRAFHTATRLNDGTILLAGGEDDTNGGSAHQQLKTAEIYDPSTGSFTATIHNMTAGRDLATATLIAASGTALDGQVLIAGGKDVDFTTLNTAEIFNPSGQTFTQTAGNMAAARDDHTASPIQ